MRGLNGGVRNTREWGEEREGGMVNRGGGQPGELGVDRRIGPWTKDTVKGEGT